MLSCWDWRRDGPWDGVVVGEKEGRSEGADFAGCEVLSASKKLKLQCSFMWVGGGEQFPWYLLRTTLKAYLSRVMESIRVTIIACLKGAVAGSGNPHTLELRVLDYVVRCLLEGKTGAVFMLPYYSGAVGLELDTPFREGLCLTRHSAMSEAKIGYDQAA